MHPAAGVDRRLWAARQAVAVVFFVNGAAYANFMSRLPALRERLTLSEKAVGLLLWALASGAMVAFRGAGALIARAGSRPVTWGAAAAFVGLLLAPAAAPTAPLAAVALFVVGVASGLMDVAMNAQAMEVEQIYRRSILAWFHGVFSLGCLVGAASGSLAAAQNLALPAHMAAVALVALPALAVASRALLPPPPRPPPGTKASSRGRTPSLLLAFGVIAFCSSVGEGAMANWAAIYLRAELGTGFGTAGMVYTAFSLAMLVGRFGGDWATAQLGAVRVVQAGGLLVAGGLGLGLAVNSVASMFLGVVAVGLGLACVVPVVFRAGGRLPRVTPSAALATLATLSYGGFLVGPPVIGLVGDWLTLRVGLALVVVLGAVMALLAPLLGRSPTGDAGGA